MAVQGLTRLRKHQFGRQAVVGTKVPAVRAYPFSGVPDVNLNWTDPEVDEGSIDPVSPPYRTRGDFTAALTDPALQYNNIPLLMAGTFGDDVEAVTGGSGQKTWTHKPASVTVDPIDFFTYEFGDDVLTDWFQLGDGLIETIEFSAPEGLGPVSVTHTWRFGSAASTGSTDSPVSGTVPTPGLTVDRQGAMVYLKDCSLYIATDLADIATSQITDALHSFRFRVTKEIDLKAWANGDQSFDVDDMAVVSRAIEFEGTFSKTSDIVGTGSEADAWFSDDAVNRFVRFHFISTSLAAGAVPYSWRVTMPLRYYTRADDAIGGNSVVILNGHAFYEPDDFEGVVESVAVNNLVSIDGAGS